MALLLKRRLFSSPAAFAVTLAAHRDSLDAAAEAAELPAEYADVLGWDEALADDETGAEAERELLARVATGRSAEDETDLLDQLDQWAARHAAPPDAKASTLIAHLRDVCRADGDWNDERIIVFTEYVDTLAWLAGLLEAHGLGGERVGILRGGMDERAAGAPQSRIPGRAGPAQDPRSAGYRRGE